MFCNMGLQVTPALTLVQQSQQFLMSFTASSWAIVPF
jgi:hypothetical protein